MASEATMVTRVRHHLATDDRHASVPLASQAAIANAIRATTQTPLPDVTVRQLATELTPQLVGAGPLAELLADPHVTDVLVTACTVWIDRGRGLERVAVDVGNDAALRHLAQRLAAACGRRLDDAQPWVDARLPDGSRLHAVLPPVSTDGVCISLRTFRARGFSLDDLATSDTLTSSSVSLVKAIVAARLSYVITGGTASGKTTLLSSLLGEVPTRERLVIVEDVTELRPPHPHVVSLQTRTANSDGAGEISLRQLIRQALRMRPDRIVVGECRGAELIELLTALNTGHDGCAGTLHANSPTDVVARLEALAALGQLPRDALHAQIAASVHCVLHLCRMEGRRRLIEIGVFTRGADGWVCVLPAWRADGGGDVSGRAVLKRLLAERGVEVPL